MPQTEAIAMGTADFTGVLVRRHYQPGQKYIQLLFQTSEGIRLSLSSSKELVRSLVPGETYAVQGQEYAVGDKRYVHEPVATLTQPAVPFIKRRARTIAVTVGVLVALGGVGIVVNMMNGSREVSQVTPKNVSIDASQSADDAGMVVATTTLPESQTPAADTAAATPSPATASSRTAPSRNRSTGSSAVTPPQPSIQQPTTPVTEQPETLQPESQPPAAELPAEPETPAGPEQSGGESPVTPESSAAEPALQN